MFEVDKSYIIVTLQLTNDDEGIGLEDVQQCHCKATDIR